MPRQRKYTDEQLARAVIGSYSIRAVLKEIGLVPAGGNYESIKKRIRELGLDTSHFLGQAILPVQPIVTARALWNRYWSAAGLRIPGDSRIDFFLKDSRYTAARIAGELDGWGTPSLWSFITLMETGRTTHCTISSSYVLIVTHCRTIIGAARRRCRDLTVRA